ncbi:sugar ABC transporter substrate-binding protein [Kineococcus sp. SYSU DK001]|uniref:sugar ABC transporter substrate-binding protein n=1 Tax=Kineococcus sp. SYSU DK001 TaxID=3383122 RepID=UPI003D7C927F
MLSRRNLLLGTASLTALGTAAACGRTTDGAAPASRPDGAGNPRPVKKILFDYPFTSLPIYAAITGIMIDYAGTKGVEIVLTNDNNDLTQQVTNLTTHLGSDVDAVVSFPADPASLDSLAQQYMAAGKHWVTYGGDLDHQDATLQFSFEQSGRQLAEDAAQWIQGTLGGRAKVLIVEDQVIQIGRERTKGLVEALAEKAPGAQIVAQQQGITPSEGLSVTTAALAQHPDIDVVLAATGDAAQGAYQALVTAGRPEDDPRTYVGGLDANLFALQRMKAGNFFRGTVTVDGVAIAQAVVDIPLALGRGETDASRDLPVSLVTPTDTAQIDALIEQFGG